MSQLLLIADSLPLCGFGDGQPATHIKFEYDGLRRHVCDQHTPKPGIYGLQDWDRTPEPLRPLAVSA